MGMAELELTRMSQLGIARGMSEGGMAGMAMVAPAVWTLRYAVLMFFMWLHQDTRASRSYHRDALCQPLVDLDPNAVLVTVTVPMHREQAGLVARCKFLQR